MSAASQEGSDLPLVTAVFLAHNRREQLRESLSRLSEETGYPSDRLELIVVDNASTDDTAQMVTDEYPSVKLIQTGRNLGAPGWNAGFQVARGDYVLILDDDAYIKPGGLEAAVRAAREHDAALVSFTIVSSYDESYQFNDEYRTGLLSYWGCAALVSRAALDALGGYDPNIFIWANELEFTMRLLNDGFVHLFLPDVVAVHMKEPGDPTEFKPLNVRNNYRHWSYVAAKLMRPSDAAWAFTSLVLQTLIEAVVRDRRRLQAFPPVIAGFTAGLRNRRPVRPVVSRTYRRNFHDFDWPWHYWRSPSERWSSWRRGQSPNPDRIRRQRRYFERRSAFYPTERASLRL